MLHMTLVQHGNSRRISQMISLIMFSSAILIYNIYLGEMVIPTHIHIKKLEDGFDKDQPLEKPGAGPGTGPIGHAEAVENSSVGQVHILLNAYMRSGSTYTGRLLCRQADTFSFTEPFWKFFVYGYLTADNDFCDTRRPQCSAAPSDKSLQSAYTILDAIYGCRLDKIKSFIDSHIPAGPGQVGIEWNNYLYCNSSTNPCMASLMKTCLARRIRVIKVIRMSLAATRPLLQRDTTLKVLQLFRDPRAVVCSRLIKTGWYKLRLESGNFTPIIENARTLCHRMTEDYIAGKQLMELFPKRVKFIRYDDLNFQFRQNLWDDVTEFLGIPEYKLGPIFRNLAFEWRGMLNYTLVELVDKECEFVYKVLGYNPLSREQLRNTTMATFIPYYDFGD